MSAVENKAPVSWTIANVVAEKDATRAAWEKDFATNVRAVADKISESITVDILEKLGGRLGDAYAPAPDSDAPLSKRYSLALKSNSAQIKEWSRESGELQPFKAWFQAFEATKQKPKEGNDFEMHAKSFVRVADKYIEVSYFQDQMASIGHRLVDTVTKSLKDFAAKPGNESLKSKVEWYRKAEKYLSNPSDFSDDELRVEVWIDTAKTANNAGSCIII